MSISSEISRISGNVSDALTAIAAKGVTVPSGSNSDDLAALIALIEGGGGGGLETENIIPQQSLNCSISLGDGAYGAVISSYVEYPQDGVEYLVTFDGTEYICRGHYRTSSILVVGDYYVTAGATYVEFPFAILLNGGSLFYLAVQGSATHMLKVDKIISYSGGIRAAD